MLIGLDVDSVLADFPFKLSSIMSKQFNTKITREDMTQFEFSMLFGMSPQEEIELMRLIFRDNEDFPPVEGAQEGCQKLLDMGFDLVAVTSRRERNITYDWLKKNELDYIKPHFLVLGDDIPTMTYFLDDAPKKIGKLYNKITHQAFILNNPWNEKCIDIFNRYVRVRDWPHFINEMQLRMD